MQPDRSDFLGFRLLYSLLASKDTTKLEQLKFDDFLPGKCRDVFAWVLDYRLQFNSLPTESAVEDKFGKILPEDVEDFQYLHSQILKRNLTFKLTKNLERVAQHLDDGDPDTALKELTDVIENGAVAPEVKVASYVKEAKERIEKYKELLLVGVFDGIPCLWPELEKVIVGYMNGTLNVFLAASGVGKTWTLCITANSCLNAGKKALFVTLEMPTIRIARRLDALRHKLSFGKMRNNVLTDDDLKNWEASVNADQTTGEVVIVDKQQVRTPQDIYLLTKKHKPDIVLIDGIYRLEGNVKGRAQWEEAAKIANDLQLYAESSNVPWLVTSQLNALADKSGKIQTSDARYSKELGICADLILALSQAPED